MSYSDGDYVYASNLLFPCSFASVARQNGYWTTATDYGLRSDVRDYRRSCMTMSGVGAVVEILGGRTVLVVLVVVVAGTEMLNRLQPRTMLGVQNTSW
jgi:hypothetical protein